MTIELDKKKIIAAIVAIVAIAGIYFGVSKYRESSYKENSVELKMTLYRYFYFSSLLCSKNTTAWSSFIYDDKDCIDLATGEISSYKYDMEKPVECSTFTQLVSSLIEVEDNAGAFVYADSLKHCADSVINEISVPSGCKEEFESIKKIYMLCNELCGKAKNPSGNLTEYTSSCNETEKQIQDLFMDSNLKGSNLQDNEETYKSEVAYAYGFCMANLKIKLAEQKAKEYEAWKIQNEKYLVQNKKKSGVVVTKSGVQYKVIKKGTGKHASPTSTVVVNYEGKTIDGNEFDSSYKFGQPFEVDLTQPRVIPGWIEALKLMSQGDVWEVTLPCDMAYGSEETGPIKPYSTLIFKIEMLKVK